jgi:uncharacterized OB-fold protein
VSTTGTTPTRFEPPASDESQPFWDATRDKKLVLQWCSGCNKAIHYPREFCPSCLLPDNLEWRDASGLGEVYAVSVQHKPQMPMAAYQNGPYAVVIVELPEGVRMMSTMTGCDPESVAVGQPVRVAWEPLSDGRHLPLFEPAS